VLKFLAGLEESGRTLAALYADPAADNVIHSRLFLVAECAAEAPRLEVGWEEVVVGQIDALTKEGLFADDAIQALALLPSAQARERVGELLEANKAAVRRAAAKALETVGERLPREVIQRLAVRLEDDYEGVRWAAAKALRKLGQRLPGEVIKKLAARLEDDD
jgi:HEAT repeat protein